MRKSARKKFAPLQSKVITVTADYEDALARVDELFKAKPGTCQGDELEVLLKLVETYEKTRFPIDPPDPIAANLFRLEQEGFR